MINKKTLKKKVHKLRFLFLTDTHIRGTNPQNRKDDFLKTLFDKMTEVFDLAKQNNVDIIIHGGDVFDRPDISPSIHTSYLCCSGKSRYLRSKPSHFNTNYAGSYR